MSRGPLACLGWRGVSNYSSHLHRKEAAVLWLSAKSKSTTSRDFLHHSIVPTDHFQQSLPRLPVPDLDKTCERYLASQEVLLSADEFAKTKSLTEKFKTTDGKELHEQLLRFDKANKHTSYITDFWFDMYLRDRKPIVLNYNPFMSFTEAPKKEYNNQLLRAANMIISSMRFMKTLRANILEPEIYHVNPQKSDTDTFRRFVRLLPKSVSFYGAYLFKAFPLDMSQFQNLFSSTRIPKLGKDILYRTDSARHMLVVRNGNFYVFDVLDKQGNILPGEHVLACVQHVLNDKAAKPEHPLGYLTTENRDTWATLREHLVSDPGNREQLDILDTALFSLVLEDTQPARNEDLAHTFLHGDGANRWFDKSFSLILTPDGTAAINFEHSWGDGVAVLSYLNKVWKDSNDLPIVHPSTAASPLASGAVRRLDFRLDDRLKAAIQTAKSGYHSTCGNLQLELFEYHHLGKDVFKQLKLSPDSMLQFIIQLAHSRCYGGTAATYESCSTAAFKHGRTETIRPATVHTKRACELFNSSASGWNKEQLRTALAQCSQLHGQLTVNAAMGQGFDRHLFAMRKLAEASGKVPDFYRDPAYQKINHVILSTSTLSSPAVKLGAFAPVVDDGLGIGYAVDAKRIGSVVTSYTPHKRAADFKAALLESSELVHKVLA